jgi:dTDP-4-amino-4,6-dideoxy-D-galactose acyltransferase
MSDPYQILSWDSDFFGFKVAQLANPDLNPSTLGVLLRALRENAVGLVYWASNPHDEGSQRAALMHGGFLADRRIMYVRIADRVPENASSVPVEQYAQLEADSSLESLALQAGAFSRFNTDPRISRDKFELLYRIWIRRSADRTLAHAILVTRQSGKIVGMITVGEKRGRGHIGLVAVDEAMRGRKIGSSLLVASLVWFREHGYATVEVVTQGANVAGCKLYENFGFRPEKSENIYHFWLKE